MKKETKQKIVLGIYISVILLIFPIGTSLYTLYCCMGPEIEVLNVSQCIEELNIHFHVFPETEIIEGQWKHYSPMGDALIIKFNLPETHSPREWLLRMANEITKKGNVELKLNSDCRIEKSNRFTDAYYVEYDPVSKHYTAHSSWD